MKFLGLEIDLVGKRADPVLTRNDWWTPVLSSSSVSPQSAMRQTMVYACVKIIAETLASAPLITYRRLPDGSRERASDLDIYKILNVTPQGVDRKQQNLKLSRVEWIENLMVHALLRGNAYSFIKRNRLGTVGFVPMNPDYVTPVVKDDTLVSYKFTHPKTAKVVELDPNEVLHFRGMSYDGISGVSTIEEHRNTISLLMSKTKYEEKLYEQGAKFSGVIELPELMSDGAYGRLKESFRKEYTGVDNMHKVAILEEGASFKPTAMTQRDALFVDSLKLSEKGITRIFRVPPFLVSDMDKLTYNNVENLNIIFTTHTIRPWAIRLEQALARDVLWQVRGATSRDDLFCEFNLEAILRGDIKTRYEAYKIGLGYGFLSPNDIRRLENFNPIEGGDRYFIPANNMVPLDKLDEFFDNNNSNTGNAVKPGGDGQGSDEEEKDKSRFDLALVKTRENFSDIFESVLTRMLKNETRSVVRIFEQVVLPSEAEADISGMFARHQEVLADSLRSPVRALSEQLVILGLTLRQQIKPLPANYVENYAASYLQQKREKLHSAGSTKEAISFAKAQLDGFSFAESSRIVKDIMDKMVGSPSNATVTDH